MVQHHNTLHRDRNSNFGRFVSSHAVHRTAGNPRTSRNADERAVGKSIHATLVYFKSHFRNEVAGGMRQNAQCNREPKSWGMRASEGVITAALA
jgi:hypothetical protein